MIVEAIVFTLFSFCVGVIITIFVLDLRWHIKNTSFENRCEKIKKTQLRCPHCGALIKDKDLEDIFDVVGHIRCPECESVIE